MVRFCEIVSHAMSVKVRLQKQLFDTKMTVAENKRKC